MATKAKTTSTTRTVALYLRVSTMDQTTENQRLELVAVAARHGWTIVATFEDVGISGSKGKDQRPGLSKLHAAAMRKDFDMVLSWSIDRLGRSMVDVVNLIEDFRAKGIGLYLHQQGIDSSTPSGTAFLQMAGVFAQLERGLIVERVKAGIARARAQGKRFGRPTVGDEVEDKIRALRAQGMGKRKISQTLKIGLSVVQRVTAACEAGSAGEQSEAA